MSDRPISDNLRYVHFLTFSCERRRRLLDLDYPRRILLHFLADQLERQAGGCVGFVLMPEHVHAIVWFAQAGQLSPFVQAWKRRSGLAIKGWYRDHAPNYFRSLESEGARFWQGGFYDFAIYSRAKLEEKLAYMHLNPVRAGLVDRCAEWPWSSARWYESGRSVGVPLEWAPGLEGSER